MSVSLSLTIVNLLLGSDVYYEFYTDSQQLAVEREIVL